MKLNAQKVEALMNRYNAYDMVQEKEKMTCLLPDMTEEAWEEFEAAIDDMEGHYVTALEMFGIIKVKIGVWN